ncbi:MAG: extensin family protein [Xanthobacteraceae bacterium]
MTRGVRLYLVGSFVLVSLAGCGRGFFQTAEREPWRREAEMACLKAGEVRENVNLVRVDPINGPGVCGAEFPLKVSALDTGMPGNLGYVDDLRPPGGIPNAQAPRWPIAPPPPPEATPSPYPAYPAPPSYPGASQPIDPRYSTQGPVSLIPPGVRPADDDDGDASAGAMPDYPSDASRRDRAVVREPVQPPLPRLGPAQGAPVNSIGPVAMKPAATLACPIVSVLDRWITEAVQPAALRWFGAPVIEIKQISAYSCRGMNGNPNAHISEHAFGNALDVAGFMLADGRRISVKDGWHGLAEEQGFLRDVQAAACQRFNTVLAPGSNAYHYDHIHVDLMRRASGRIICEPAAMSGEQVAARVSLRNAARPYEAGVTGSISARPRHGPAPKAAADDDDDDE